MYSDLTNGVSYYITGQPLTLKTGETKDLTAEFNLVSSGTKKGTDAGTQYKIFPGAKSDTLGTIRYPATTQYMTVTFRNP